MPPAKKREAPPPPPKKKEEEQAVEEGLPIWMATFADMVTLLLCFFVLLLSFAQQDLSKFKSLMGSIKESFGVQVKRPEADYAAFSPSKYERKDLKLDQQNKEMLSMILQFKAMVEDNEDVKKSANINPEENGLVVRVGNAFLFQPGSATLKPGVNSLIEPVLTLIKDYNYGLVVRGHTSDTPLTGSSFASNWELSAARAAATLHYILNHSDISPNRLKAVGYADSLPLVPNNSPANRNINDRTEFFFHHPDVKTW